MMHQEDGANDETKIIMVFFDNTYRLAWCWSNW